MGFGIACKSRSAAAVDRGITEAERYESVRATQKAPSPPVGAFIALPAPTQPAGSSPQKRWRAPFRAGDTQAHGMRLYFPRVDFILQKATLFPAMRL